MSSKEISQVPGEPRWATTDDVADYLKVSVNTVRRMAERGDFTTHRLGPRLIRFDLNEVDATLTTTTTAEAAAQ